MRFIDEYRDPAAIEVLLGKIERTTSRPWMIMEICGGQTHTLIKAGIDRMLPDAVTLVHGPGCPVCVTPLELIDKALAIAARPEVIFASFGDMLRVPGSGLDLLGVKARGGDVRIVYSPLDAVALARSHPEREVVFFAVGFETTAPANAMAVWQASREGLRNFSILSTHVLVPPAMEAILNAPDNGVQGFLAAGHVCTVMGTAAYDAIAANHRIPIVATGFEPLDLVQGIAMTVSALEEGRFGVENQYARSVRVEGNPQAQAVVDDVFEVCDRAWRGIGRIANSGYCVRPAYADFDAEKRFAVDGITTEESPMCIAGAILRGVKKPTACEAFGRTCTPEHPIGAPMVSSEGACAAYYLYTDRADAAQ